MNLSLLSLLGLTAVAWAVIIPTWQRGVYAAIAYMSLQGVVVVLLYPSPYPAIFKDLLCVIPAYLGILLYSSMRPGKLTAMSLPGGVTASLAGLVSLVLLQSFNPNVTNWAVAAIGLKVWLFYVPLTFLAYLMAGTREGIVALLRCMLIVSIVPCVVGLLEWVAVMSGGYVETMTRIYGDAASSMTQGFARVGTDLGTQAVKNMIYRIPSTFPSVSQYFGFTIASMVPAYALMHLESGRWRLLARVMLPLIVLASFLSGARAAYVLVPVLLGTMYLFEARAGRFLRATVGFTVVFLLAMYIADIDVPALLGLMQRLVFHYGSVAAIGLPAQAIVEAPFGMGTGMNTGAARYAFANAADVVMLHRLSLESYYAKTIYELGIMGLVALVSLYVTLARFGFRTMGRLEHGPWRKLVGAITAFVMLIAFSGLKGWQVDLDPINVYYWLFAGILFRIGASVLHQKIPAKVVHSSTRPLST